MFQKNPTSFSAFAERIFQKAIFLKNETTKTLLRTVKTSILEPEKTTALSDEACLPRLCFEQNFMMENLSSPFHKRTQRAALLPEPPVVFAVSADNSTCVNRTLQWR